MLIAANINSVRINYSQESYVSYAWSSRGKDVIQYNITQAAQSTRRFFSFLDEVTIIVGLISKYRKEVFTLARWDERWNRNAVTINLEPLIPRLEAMGWEHFGGSFKKGLGSLMEKKKSKTVGLTEGLVSSEEAALLA